MWRWLRVKLQEMEATFAVGQIVSSTDDDG